MQDWQTLAYASKRTYFAAKLLKKAEVWGRQVEGGAMTTMVHALIKYNYYTMS